MKKQIYVILCLAFLGSNGFSQPLEVTNAATDPFTPENLITNIFLGEGVEVTSVVFDGDPLAVGFFKNGQDHIGIERGIVMTSGRAATVGNGPPFGTNSLGNNFASNTAASSASDPDIAAISSVSTNDVCKYTISFIPTSDTIRFNYVFGSEEYPEYACSSFNDVFGFFISGPGISGPFENGGENIALIPGTNTPVAINNVHPQNGGGCPAVFEEFYNNNNGIALQPTYDGFLDVFTAEAVVIPCEEYTIKLIIADGGDTVFDSGVFLEAKSFGAPTLEVDAATVSLDGTITEGCADGNLTFSLPSPTEEDFFIDYNIIGTAINGTDYDFIPEDLFIPAGDSSVSVPIVAIVDDIDEDLESIAIDVQRDVCNRDTFYIFIRDNELIVPDAGLDTTICRGDSVALDATLDIPLPPPPSFTNPNDIPIAPTFSSVTSDIVVAGVQPIYLGPGVIQSVCINIDHKWVDDLDVFLISPGGQFIELTTDNGANCDHYIETCFTTGAPVAIQDVFPIGQVCSSGENPPYTGDFLPEGVWSDLWDGGDNPTNGVWQLLVQDDQNGFNGTILDWTITFEPLYQLFYRWEPEIDMTCYDCPDPIAFPEETTTYTVYVSDTYGCETSDEITINVLDVLPAPNAVCGIITNNSITFNWDDVQGNSGFEINVEGAGWIDPNNTQFSHIVGGLTLSDTISVEVRAVGECDGEITTVVCWTPDCDAPIPSVEGVSHIDCFNETDGSIEISATGGSAGGGYTYTLDGEANTTGIFSNLGAGVQEVMVEDGLGCANFIQVNITQPDSFYVEPMVINDISCNAGNDGSATVEVTGGSYPYTYNWNGNQADSVATLLTVGDQFVTITDQLGCEVTTSIEITEPIALSLQTDSTWVNCNSGDDGTATATPSGGTGTYTYLWDNNADDQTTETASSLPAGNYSVTVSDLNGCQIVTDVDVLEPEALSTQISMTPVDCFDNSTGSATVVVDGGTPNYTYNWNVGDDTDISQSLPAGIATVTITDLNNCEIIDSIEVIQPDVLELNLTPAHVTCNAGSNGTILAEVQGGFGNYTYTWSDTQDTEMASNLAANNYCVTVTDENGCEISDCLDINEPDELILDSATTPAGCNGGTDGTIDLMVNGGTGVYTYNWSTGDDMEDLGGLGAATYTVTVTDENMCQATLEVELIDSDAIQTSFTQDDIACFGAATGNIDVTATGGIGGFMFEWTGPNGFTSDLEDLQNVPAGDYTVILSDAQGCMETLSMTLTEPATAISAEILPLEMICFEADNGFATVDPTGGTGNYTFEWSDGQNTATADNLTSGSYFVTVTDENGCTTTDLAIIQDQDELTLSLTQTGANCHDGNDGTAQIASVLYGNSAANVSDFSIDWSVANQNNPTIDNLVGGQNYSVTITDALGCTAENNIDIVNPAEIGATVELAKIVSCFDGSDGAATAAGAGGTEPYVYLWDSNAGSQPSATAGNLSAGFYQVTVTDNNGCSTTTQIELENPIQISTLFSNTDVRCNGEANGASLVNVDGGASPYLLNWENGSTLANAENLPGGYQSITITDSNGCEFVDSTLIDQPETPVLALAEVQDVRCAGYQDGQISLFPDGGTPPYSYSLNGIDYFGSSVLIGLEAGEYDIFVQDARGCIYSESDLTITEPDPLMVDIGNDTTINFGQAFWLDPNYFGADISNFTFQWTASDTSIHFTNPTHSGTGVTVLNPATYTLMVTDENGCIVEDQIVLFVDKIREVIVPTGFAPGNGGVNNSLHIHGKSSMVENVLRFQVFDRWGELLYEMTDFDINDTSIGWDGTFKGQDMPSGNYVWVAEVEYVDGVVELLKGSTTLIR